jgi:hypothetical protein
MRRSACSRPAGFLAMAYLNSAVEVNAAGLLSFKLLTAGAGKQGWVLGGWGTRQGHSGAEEWTNGTGCSRWRCSWCTEINSNSRHNSNNSATFTFRCRISFVLGTTHQSRRTKRHCHTPLTPYCAHLFDYTARYMATGLKGSQVKTELSAFCTYFKIAICQCKVHI